LNAESRSLIKRAELASEMLESLFIGQPNLSTTEWRSFFLNHVKTDVHALSEAEPRQGLWIYQLKRAPEEDRSTGKSYCRYCREELQMRFQGYNLNCTPVEAPLQRVY
jgi:hypothetical protein